MSTDAKRAGNARHLNKMDDIKIRVPKGKRAELKEYAEAQGESLQGWIIRLLEADSGIAIRWRILATKCDIQRKLGEKLLEISF